MQGGILEDRPADSGVRSALLADPELSERQKQVLIEIYESFRKENAASAETQAADAAASTTEAAAEAMTRAAAEAATEAIAEAADDEPAFASSWSAATAEAERAEAEQDEPSGNADDVSGQTVPPIR